MKNYDIAIVGAGILGVAHAFFALKNDLKVALLEKEAAPQAATVRNFGQIVPSGMDNKWQALGRQSLAVYKAIQAQVDISVRQEGSIYIASDAEEMRLLEELAKINKGNDYASTLLSKEECLQKYPGLKSDYVLGGLFFPEEVTLDPRVAIHRIITFLREQYSLDYYPNTSIHHIETGKAGHQLINNQKLAIQAAKVLICSGSDFQTLYPKVFKNSDLKYVKLQMLSTYPQTGLKIPGSILTGWTIRRYESFQECPSYVQIKAKEDPAAFHRQWGIHILFKQSADGRVIIGDSHEYQAVNEEKSLDFQMDSAINEAIIQEAKRIYTLPNFKIEKSWIGIYSQCQERDIFEAEPLPDVHIVTGIGGKGMTGSFGWAEQNIKRLFHS
ncbi:MAG: TIGR03364 family FAD-dependent oxidoreductase [Saprospiraceae bacterium]